MDFKNEGDIVIISVGGTEYHSSLSTLTKDPNSIFTKIFNNEIPRDSKGRVFIDRDGRLFRYILNYLRNEYLTIPDDPDLIRELIF